MNITVAPPSAAILDVIDRRHDVMRGDRPDALDDLLADEAVMCSPVVFAPQRGKAIVAMDLESAKATFAAVGFDADDGPSFRYVEHVVSGDTECWSSRPRWAAGTSTASTSSASTTPARSSNARHGATPPGPQRRPRTDGGRTGDARPQVECRVVSERGFARANDRARSSAHWCTAAAANPSHHVQVHQ